jgi:hypothetical protein
MTSYIVTIAISIELFLSALPTSDDTPKPHVADESLPQLQAEALEMRPIITGLPKMPVLRIRMPGVR